MVKRYPDSLYKYKCYEYAIEIIKDNLIYVPKPQLLNDPFESDIKFDLTELKKSKIKEEYVNYLIQKFNSIIENNKLNKDELCTNLLENIIPKLINCFVKHREDLYYKDYSNYGILSLTDIYDDIVMWSHYADMHKGVCIKFNTEKLIFSGLFNSGFKVIYDDKYPLLDILTLISPKTDIEIKLFILLFFNKHISWKYENEYRIIKIFGHHRGKETSNQRKVKIDSDYIEEVILGSRFPKDKMDEIKSICKEKGIPLFQMKNIPFQYKIEKQLIQE